MYATNIPKEILNTPDSVFVSGISQYEFEFIKNSFGQYENIKDIPFDDLSMQISYYCVSLFNLQKHLENGIHGIIDITETGINPPSDFQYLFFAMNDDETITEETFGNLLTFVYQNIAGIPWRVLPTPILELRLKSEFDEQQIQHIIKYYEQMELEDEEESESHIYKLPNLTTLMHIPACEGQVFEGYDHSYYLESKQMLQDFLDEIKEPVAKYQIKISNMKDFYKQLPKDTEQIEETNSIIEH